MRLCFRLCSCMCVCVRVHVYVRRMCVRARTMSTFTLHYIITYRHYFWKNMFKIRVILRVFLQVFVVEMEKNE